VGWLAPVIERERQAVALHIWERHPDEALLDAVEAAGSRSALLARLDIAEVAYDSTEGSAEIDLESFAAAEPDPVHASAYQIRSHINRNHLGELAVLARAACGTPPGAAWMWELDRFGATLLVRRGSLDGDPDHVLVRIPWLLPVDSAEGLEAEMRGAMSWARGCTCG
jgi:hypothetical protein